MDTKIELYLNSTTDFTIVDQHGTVYTPESAKALWENGDVDAYNIAFFRLVRHGFDIEATRKSYTD